MSDMKQLREKLDLAEWKDPGPCNHCNETIREGDPRSAMIAGSIDTATGKLTFAAVWLHRECMMRVTIGGALHIDRLCDCFVKDGPVDSDPPGLSKREAALAAAEAWRRTRSN